MTGLSGQSRRRRHHGHRHQLEHPAGRARSSAPARWSTGSIRTSCGRSGRTSSRCPPTARNATSGWAGWATPQTFVRAATYNADVAAFFTKWLVDVDDAQKPDGDFADVAPRIVDSGRRRGRLGRRRHDLPLDHLPGVQRSRGSWKSTTRRWSAGWSSAARTARTCCGPRGRFRRLALDQGRYAAGRDRHGLFRPQHPSDRRRRPHARQDKTTPASTTSCSSRSRRRSTRPMLRPTAGSRATRRPAT